MRAGPAPSPPAERCRAPPGGTADLFPPGAAGDGSLSASLPACALLSEVPSRTGPGAAASEPAWEAGPRPPPPPPSPRRRGAAPRPDRRSDAPGGGRLHFCPVGTAGVPGSWTSDVCLFAAKMGG